MNYYAHNAAGQWEVLSKRRPIDGMLEDPEVEADLKQRLERVRQIRRFASDQLKLPDNASYTSYSALHREFVVWAVFATPEFDTTPTTWCFPIVGCVGYRGYFSAARAQAFAAQLADQGFDVYVGGVSAYSTLGWFADPVLDTMLPWKETRLANVIFHELAHQQYYLRGDTEFNESFASSVGEAGVERWLAGNAKADQWRQFQLEQRYQAEFVDLVLRTRRRLTDIYSSGLPDDQKRTLKKRAFSEMINEYRAIRADWDGYSGYDEWMFGELNNAKLAAVASYQRQVPGFRKLLARSDGDFAAYYRAVARLGELDEQERRACLAALADDHSERIKIHCPANQ
jgi:predicted aminopeptidase